MPNNMKKAGIKYSKGGPKTSNYVGNPIGYFNDKAEYGKYMMQTAGETTKAGVKKDEEKGFWESMKDDINESKRKQFKMTKEKYWKDGKNPYAKANATIGTKPVMSWMKNN